MSDPKFWGFDFWRILHGCGLLYDALSNADPWKSSWNAIAGLRAFGYLLPCPDCMLHHLSSIRNSCAATEQRKWIQTNQWPKYGMYEWTYWARSLVSQRLGTRVRPKDETEPKIDDPTWLTTLWSVLLMMALHYPLHMNADNERLTTSETTFFWKWLGHLLASRPSLGITESGWQAIVTKNHPDDSSRWTRAQFVDIALQVRAAFSTESLERKSQTLEEYRGEQIAKYQLWQAKQSNNQMAVSTTGSSTLSKTNSIAPTTTAAISTTAATVTTPPLTHTPVKLHRGMLQATDHQAILKATMAAARNGGTTLVQHWKNMVAAEQQACQEMTKSSLSYLEKETDEPNTGNVMPVPNTGNVRGRMMPVLALPAPTSNTEKPLVTVSDNVVVANNSETLAFQETKNDQTIIQTATTFVETGIGTSESETAKTKPEETAERIAPKPPTLPSIGRRVFPFSALEYNTAITDNIVNKTEAESKITSAKKEPLVATEVASTNVVSKDPMQKPTAPVRPLQHPNDLKHQMFRLQQQSYQSIAKGIEEKKNQDPPMIAQPQPAPTTSQAIEPPTTTPSIGTAMMPNEQSDLQKLHQQHQQQREQAHQAHLAHVRELDSWFDTIKPTNTSDEKKKEAVTPSSLTAMLKPIGTTQSSIPSMATAIPIQTSATQSTPTFLDSRKQQPDKTPTQWSTTAKIGIALVAVSVLGLIGLVVYMVYAKADRLHSEHQHHHASSSTQQNIVGPKETETQTEITTSANA